MAVHCMRDGQADLHGMHIWFTKVMESTVIHAEAAAFFRVPLPMQLRRLMLSVTVNIMCDERQLLPFCSKALKPGPSDVVPVRSS